MNKQLTTTELAKKLHVHPNRVRQWVDQGRLKPVHTLGNGYMLFTNGTKKPKSRGKGGRPRTRSKK